MNWEKRFDELRENKRVVLYGAGKYGKIALENIKKYLPQLEVLCFIDDNKLRNNGKIEDIAILSLEEAVSLEKDFNILITNYYISSVLEKIENYNFDMKHVFFWGELLIEDVKDSFLIENAGNLWESYQCLSDCQSKLIFDCLVQARKTKNIDLLGRTCQQRQYFPEDVLMLDSNEVFVDAGAFDGDTIDNFLECTGNCFKFIYAFEPDKANYEKLVGKEYGSNVITYNAGLYDKTAELCFLANKGGSSQIRKDGEDRIHAVKFDELNLPDKEVTFVKMDIEGSELQALKGMEKMIKRCRPKMAICIYHKFEDLWEIPLYIKKLVPEYKFYIRNYTTYLDEVVLYAVMR